MKRPNLNPRHPPAFLVVFVSLVTVFMYLIAVGVNTPGDNRIAFIAVVCACMFIFTLLLLLALPAIIGEFHRAIMDWKEREHRYRTLQADREHYYAHRRRMRELEEKRYRHKYRFPVYRHRPRNVRVQRRPKDSDLTNYGC